MTIEHSNNYVELVLVDMKEKKNAKKIGEIPSIRGSRLKSIYNQILDIKKISDFAKKRLYEDVEKSIQPKNS